MMTDMVRDQYIQLTQFVISRDWKCVDQFHKLGRRTSPVKKRVAVLTIWSDEEKRIIALLYEAHQKFVDLFEKELCPAVSENNIDRVHQILRQSEGLLLEVLSLNSNLEALFRRKLTLARNKQAAVAESAKRSPFLFFGAAVALSLLIVAYLGRNISDPIRKLIRGTEEIAGGNLSARIALGRHDEFGRLAESFNRMTQELREHQQRIIQSEKMASLGQLAAGVAHEINNPVAVILGYTKVLLGDMKPGDRFYDELKAMEEEARQCQRIINELRNFSRPTELLLEPVDAREVADEALDRLERAAAGSPITVAKDYGPAPPLVSADRGKLREVLLNIVQNAADAMPQGGDLKITIRRAAHQDHGNDAQASSEDFVLIEVSDTGAGISEENMRRLFEPFFSTKERGMGLGLAISYAIVKAHKGFINVQSKPGQSTTFSIGIPVANGASRNQEA
jgi:signal transduction histidine kinase